MYFELRHHGPQLKRIIDDQHVRLCEAQDRILKVEEKQSNLEHRIAQAIQQHSFLEERLKRLRNLPGAHKKPLSRAEREFKSELGNLSCVLTHNSNKYSEIVYRFSFRKRNIVECTYGNPVLVLT